VSKAPGTEFPTDKQRPRPQKEAYDIDTGWDLYLHILEISDEKREKKKQKKRCPLGLDMYLLHRIADDQSDNTRTCMHFAVL
jgi:hypothetical protein